MESSDFDVVSLFSPKVPPNGRNPDVMAKRITPTLQRSAFFVSSLQSSIISGAIYWRECFRNAILDSAVTDLVLTVEESSFLSSAILFIPYATSAS